MNSPKRALILLMAAALSGCIHAQTRISPKQINFAAHFSSPPVAPTANTPYLFLDDSSAHNCTGGGSSVSWCSWNGSAWVSVGSPGGGVWGSITGTLSSQTDLNTALSGKQATLTNYSTISGLTGYPSTFPPVNNGNWAGTWQGNSPSNFQNQNTTGTAGGLSGTAITGDAGNSGNAFTVKGLFGVPFCTGFTPTSGQAIEYTTAGSPNPCYTAASTGSGGTVNVAPQYNVAYYSATGTTNTIGGAAISGLVAASAGAAPGAATAHNISAPLSCSDTSGSGITQVCNTTPSFTPQAGDTIIYTTTTTTTGPLTINVNSSGAKSVKKFGGFGSQIGDVQANTPVLMIFDGISWQAVNTFSFFLASGSSGGNLASRVPLTEIASTGGTQFGYLDGTFSAPAYVQRVTTASTVSANAYANLLYINASTGNVTVNLPDTYFAEGRQQCLRNASGKSGVLTFAVASGATIDFNGVAGTTGTGTLVSSGALGDAVCLVSDGNGPSEIWYVTSIHGTWTNH